MSFTRKVILTFALVALAAVVATGATAATSKRASTKAGTGVNVQVFAPRPGDAVGKLSKGFLVDLAVQYPSLAASGADFQLTGRRRTRTRPRSPVPSQPAPTRRFPA
jgi:hypothetical protein